MDEIDNNETNKKTRLLMKKKTEDFQKEWLEIYKWLIYNSSKNLMFAHYAKAIKIK
ncbi:hypothetical protein C1645_840072 [Glomus cerebriforme]|uniref:Uncharacterized protein n=1 Tax=Glomus cerebriforme TaxID=658196 RepID=A0A397SAI2_9GLOM|nr:hypothetical protein C1645_840072 [Glomus cerebriforme]